MEIQKTALEKNERVLICDDLLATGGTAKAVVELVHKLKGNIIEIAFFIELMNLNGANNLGDINKYSLIQF